MMKPTGLHPMQMVNHITTSKSASTPPRQASTQQRKMKRESNPSVNQYTSNSSLRNQQKGNRDAKKFSNSSNGKWKPNGSQDLVLSSEKVPLMERKHGNQQRSKNFPKVTQFGSIDLLVQTALAHKHLR